MNMSYGQVLSFSQKIRGIISAGLMLVLLVVVGSISAPAQNNPNEEQGLKPYDSFHGGDLDSISLTNGGLSVHIPLASFPQRGDLDLSFSLSYSSKQWRVKPAKCCDAGGHLGRVHTI